MEKRYRIRKKVNNIAGTTYFYVDVQEKILFFYTPWESTGWCSLTLEEAKERIDNLLRTGKNVEEITIINYP